MDKHKDNRLIFLSLFPITGMFGIHDFKMGKNALGALHIILSAIPVGFLLTTSLLGLFSGGPYLLAFNMILAAIFSPLAIVSYIIATVEGFNMIIDNKKGVPVKKSPHAIPLVLSLLVLYTALCIFYHVVQDSEGKNYGKICLIFNCYSGNSIYGLGAIVISIWSLFCLLLVKRPKSFEFWFFIAMFDLSLINIFTAFIFNINLLFI